MEMLSCLILFILSLLSGMGIGAAGLPVVYFTHVCHMEQLQAQGYGLLVFEACAFFSLFNQRKNLPIKLLAWLLFAGIPGVLLGSALACRLSGTVLRRVFGVFSLAVGYAVLWRVNRQSRQKKKKMAEKHL